MCLFCLTIPASKKRVYSGGEVDRDAGTAFMYITVEELKTVNAPTGRGLSSTTTKVVRDQKVWLNKAEPEEDEVFKHLPESWLAATDPTDLDPMAADDQFANPLYTKSTPNDISTFENPSYGMDPGYQSTLPTARQAHRSSAAQGAATRGYGPQRIGRHQRAPANVSDEKAFMLSYSMYLNSSTT